MCSQLPALCQVHTQVNVLTLPYLYIILAVVAGNDYEYIKQYHELTPKELILLEINK